MAKKIVFCADGTWNGPPDTPDGHDVDADPKQGGQHDSGPTNVVKLFENLAGDVTPDTRTLPNEQEKVLLDAAGRPVQVAKYLHGVGDSPDVVLRTIGGVFGAGVIARVVRGYTFISRHYQPGDAIYLLGFSRGAYTTRALGGMIANVGLLDPARYDPDDKAQAYGLAVSAWQRSRKQAMSGANKLMQLTNWLVDAAQHFAAKPLPDDMLRAVDTIEAIAVWDTVGSMGIPLYDIRARQRTDVFAFTDSTLSKKVRRGLHAMAIDERRADFPVTDWHPAEKERIEQVWFTGAHADVGGGYPVNESSLSDQALGWMMAKLDAAGLEFAPALRHEPGAVQGAPAIHEPWSKLPFSVRPKAMRTVKPGDAIHVSVAERFAADQAYRPEAMKAALGGKGLEEVFVVDRTRWERPAGNRTDQSRTSA